MSLHWTRAAEPNPDFIASRATLADSLLKLEFDSAVDDNIQAALDYLVHAATLRFGPSRNKEPEVEVALRFFRSVDQALIEAGVIYPPHGQIDLLRNALKPRDLSPED